MENNELNETLDVSTNEEFDPFANTPWTSDDEIYDFVIHKKYMAEWDWEYIWNELVEKGIPLIMPTPLSNKQKNKARRQNVMHCFKELWNLPAAFCCV